MIIKRSVRIAGHMTSVSLEKPFWDTLESLARARGLTLGKLIEEVDARRDKANLSSALRVYILSCMQK